MSSVEGVLCAKYGQEGRYLFASRRVAPYPRRADQEPRMNTNEYKAWPMLREGTTLYKGERTAAVSRALCIRGYWCLFVVGFSWASVRVAEVTLTPAVPSRTLPALWLSQRLPS